MDSTHTNFARSEGIGHRNTSIKDDCLETASGNKNLRLS
jgi:hypothetical protein